MSNADEEVGRGARTAGTVTSSEWRPKRGRSPVGTKEGNRLKGRFSYNLRLRGRGGIGRRTGFRFPWGNTRAGSSPVARMFERSQLAAGRLRRVCRLCSLWRG